MNPSVRGFVIWSSLLLAAPSFAHHSVALYDTDHLTTVKGTVTRIEWTSPHVFVFFATAAPGGATAEWSMVANRSVS